MLKLTQKQTQFTWNDAHQAAFTKLKELFSTAPILSLWDDNRETVLEADCSGYVIGGCLSQKSKDGQLKPVAYMSKKLSSTESNYDIYDKELLAIVRCMEEWRGMLIGLSKPFSVITDHHNLKYFMTTRRLNERQIRWSQFLSQFNFKLEFRPGRLGQRPDALSRRDQDMPHDKEDTRLSSREQRLIKETWMSAISVSNEVDTGLYNVPKGDVIFYNEQFQNLWN